MGDGVTPMAAQPSPRSRPFRVLHWNVFEDGLTDAPGSIGLSSDFGGRFDALLSVLGADSGAGPFLGFQSARNLTMLPNVVPITSAAAFFGFLDLAYTCLYHSLGGELRLGPSAPGALPDLGNSLRSLFLHTALVPGSAGAPAVWTTPRFEAEVAKAVGGLPPEDAEAVRGTLQSIRERTFLPATGALRWERDTVQTMWKRHNNVWHDKWQPDLSVFLRAPQTEEQAQALARFCTRREDAAAPSQAGGALRALIEVQVSGAGELEVVQTLTLQHGMKAVLEALCEHSLQCGAAAAAICAFGGVAEAPASARERAALVLHPLTRQVQQWSDRSSLPLRHTQVCGVLAKEAPAVVTLVEYDEQWRRLALPSAPRYMSARHMSPPRGCGQASIWFDSDAFEPVDSLPGVSIPDIVRSEKARGVGESDISPKSSCMMLLRRRRSDSPAAGSLPAGHLVLVAAIHLESAPPSDTRKVLCRRQQLRAAVGEVGAMARALAAGGHRAVLVLGGDCNAIREEFVLGTGDAFYSSPGATAIRPNFRRPTTGEVVGQALGPPLARLGADGALRLLCDAADGGELWEASGKGIQEGEVACTRAGRNMVIDFIFVGTVGEAGDVKTRPHALVTPQEAEQAADVAFGIHNAVLRWGSDHLPVACDVAVGGTSVQNCMEASETISAVQLGGGGVARDPVQIKL